MAQACKLYFYDTPIETEDFQTEILAGLRRSPKTIHPKYFYDAAGSKLFDAICELPEYYPTRTEIGILQSFGAEMAEHIDDRCVLIELGSGNSRKVRLLLEALRPSVYMPLDISKEHLLDAAQRLVQDYPWLEIRAACTDYSKVLRLPPYRLSGVQKVAFFPGSSIGNFEPHDALTLLRNLHDVLGSGGGFLIGVDLKKDSSILWRAYNDRQGVTAAFNLNMLRRLNRDLNGDFDLAKFSHYAFYNADLGRVEMHLLSRCQQQVRIGGETIDFYAGETIHTENSHKYSVEEFQTLAREAGFTPVAVWTDIERLFSVHYCWVK